MRIAHGPRCIFRSKGRLLSVEEELNSLHRSIQQTCGSRRQGITLLRRKIETQNDKVLTARQRYFAARKARQAECTLGSRRHVGAQSYVNRAQCCTALQVVC